MGLADRDYQRRPSATNARLTPVVRFLLWFQGGLFLLDYLVLPLVFDLPTDGSRKPPIVEWGAFSVHSAIDEGRVWEFLTFQFLHDSVGHVLFNSVGLFFFGPWAERWWGSSKFLLFYLLCGCAGAGLFTLFLRGGIVPGSVHSGLIGASAGIYGIFVAVAVIAPNMRVMLLFPPVELTMRQLAIALMVLSVVLIQTGWLGNQGGEAGHLGGFVAGFLLMKFPWLLGGAKPARPVRRIPPGPPKLRPRTHVGGPVVDPEIDRILDKISRDGIHSVTPEERELLRQLTSKNEDPS